MKSVPCVSEASEYASRVLKVNHAGENGAVNIYAGQIFFARFTAPGMVAELVEFKSHEEGNRAIFWEELQRRNRPRCRSYWLCGVGGFTLGLVTGLFGRRQSPQPRWQLSVSSFATWSINSKRCGGKTKPRSKQLSQSSSRSGGTTISRPLTLQLASSGQGFCRP